MILSASQIESFDPSTPFGCNRKWWYERVKGLKQPKAKSLELGDAVHQTLEAFLKGAPQGVLHELVIGAPGALEYLIALRKRVGHVEIKFDDLKLAGVPVVGKIDWIAAADGRLELGDHKTTSVIAKYAKTPLEIRQSVQMNIYAKWLFKTDASMVATQDFFQTRGAKKFEVVSTEITKRENSARILEVEATVEKMVATSSKQSPEDIEPNEKACHIGTGCPHRSYCPLSGVLNMASLLDMFSASPAVPPVTQDVAPPSPAPQVLSPEVVRTAAILGVPVQSVLPPDAPKSDPALAAKPLETPKAEPEETKKRGRPPGAQNKPKDLTGPVTIERITIRHGAKIGMPNYSSATVEVEASGLVTGSVEDAKNALSDQVRAMMVKELAVYQKGEKP